MAVWDNAKENCPVFPDHANRVHKAFDDAAARKGAEQDSIALYVALLGHMDVRVHQFGDSNGKLNI